MDGKLAAAGNGVRGLRQTRRESLHLTLRFLGDVEDPGPAIEAGQRAAALRQYDECARILRTRLN